MPELLIDNTWFIAAAALFVGAWVQTSVGFGLAVVSAPIIVVVSPLWVPIVLTMSALWLSAVNTWDQRRHLNAKAMAVPMITRLPGTVIGVWLLTQMSITALQIIVSSMVLLAVIVTYWAPHYPANRLNLGIAGAISGLTGAATAIGGTPMAIVMQHGDPRETRANLSLYFTYSCIVSLIGYYWAGLLHLELLVESMSFAPIILIGYFIGVKTRYLIDAKRFRSILMFLCLIAGVSALIGALW